MQRAASRAMGIWPAGALALVAALFCCCGGVAWAAVIHKFEPTITTEIQESAKKCTGPGTVEGPLGTFGQSALTIDEDELWFADEKQGSTRDGEGARVDELDAETGACKEQLEYPGEGVVPYRGVAVGHSTGSREVYAGLGEYAAEGKRTKNVVAVFGTSGLPQHVWTGANTPAKEFPENITGVAVDEDHASMEDWASGDVLVGTEAGVIDILKPVAGGAEPPAENVWTLKGTCSTVGTVCLGAQVVPFGHVERVAVDQRNGELFVVARREEPGVQEIVVDMFLPVGVAGEYKYLGRLEPPEGGPYFPPINGIAVDGGAPDGGDVYVIVKDVVEEFGITSGKLLGRITGTSEGLFASALDVAVDPVSHRVYVGDAHDEELGEGASAIDVFGPDVVIPDVTVAAAGEVSASTAVLHGAVDPDGEGEATCVFEYGTSTAYGQSVACTKAVANGSSAVGVESPLLEGLEAGTTYHYRLSASNGNGTNQGSCPEDCGTVTTKGPRVVATSAAHITATAAKLGATIDPGGAATSYFFQYGREGEGLVKQAPVAPGSPLGAGSEAVLAPEVPVESLTPEATYDYRVVAVSDVEVTPGHVETHEFDGPEETLTTQGAGEFVLPDHRQWQLVSPPDKHGALLEPIANSPTNGTVIQAASSGNAVTYVASAPTEAAPAGNSNLVQVLSTRGPDGWSSRDLALPHIEATDAAVGPGNEYRFFSEDLSQAIVQPFGALDPAVSEEASEPAPLLRSDYVNGDAAEQCTTHCYTPLVTGCPSAEEEAKGHACPQAVRQAANVPAGTRFGEFGTSAGTVPEAGNTCPPALICGPQFVGATPDARYAVLISNIGLTDAVIPDELHGGRSLYEWSAESGKLELVSMLPDEGGQPERPAAQASLGGESQNERGAISSNGSRIFFSVAGGLYMRDVSLQRTIRLDRPEEGCGKVCGAGAAAPKFQLATRDGSKVWFTDTQRLSEDSGAKSGAADLYECAIVVSAGVPRCELTDLTPRGADGEAAGVQGTVIGAGEDGSWLYFVANGALVPGAESGDCPDNIGGNTLGELEASCNLYMRHEGRTQLIAVLPVADAPDWGKGGSVATGSLEGMTARVSPNGEWLAFMSERDLTGYDNEDVSSATPGERMDEELYLYHAPTGSLACVSCDPTGARPIGEQYAPNKATENMPIVGGNDVWFTSFSWLAADVPGWTPYRLGGALYQSRYLSNSGRLFFNAHDALVPSDTNGTWDVYEYEPQGVGTAAPCSPAVQSGSEVFKPARSFTGKEGAGEEPAGCVGLISSGESPEESAFLDASESGEDVFFLTAARLQPSEDYDSNYDVYDAHECTSASPCLPEPAAQPTACTTADECRAAPSPQPEVFGAPASATFSGPGNPGAVQPSAQPAKKPAAKPLTRAQRLKAALLACRKDRKRAARARCEASARRKYGAAKARAKGGGARAKRSSTADRRAGR